MGRPDSADMLPKRTSKVRLDLDIGLVCSGHRYFFQTGVSPQYEPRPDTDDCYAVETDRKGRFSLHETQTKQTSIQVLETQCSNFTK